MTFGRCVHVVDDDEAVREGAAILLESADFEVFSYISGDTFLKTLGAARPGCILLDINMPGLDGLAVQSELSAMGIDWPVIVLTGRGDIGLAVRAMKNGAIEFIEKPYNHDILLEALQAGFEKLESGGAAVARKEQACAVINTLSQRELQIMEALLAGLPNKAIAHELSLSVRTVEVYRANLMAKMGAGSLSSAVRIALLAGVQPRDV